MQRTTASQTRIADSWPRPCRRNQQVRLRLRPILYCSIRRSSAPTGNSGILAKRSSSVRIAGLCLVSRDSADPTPQSADAAVIETQLIPAVPHRLIRYRISRPGYPAPRSMTIIIPFIGGSARDYQEVSAPSASPATFGQACGLAACLCSARAWHERPLLPRTGSSATGTTRDLSLPARAKQR
jgi:hypothetical protein